MPTIPEIAAFDTDMRAWRHHIHAHPETAFEETATSAFVADKLRSFGLEVHAGLAGTGVVGVLRNGHSSAAVGLRADMDALDIHEKNSVPHASLNAGKMHACGHDGHTTMLLGAARAMAQRKHFDGTAYFIFQPAEENEGGGRVDGAAGTVRTLPDDGRLRHAQLARAALGGRSRCAQARSWARTTSSRSSPPGVGRTPRCLISAATRCCSPRTSSTRCRRSSRATSIRSRPGWSA